MKNRITIIALFIFAMTILSCSTNVSDEETESTQGTEATSLSKSEKRALIKAKEVALSEKRSNDQEALTAITPFYTNDNGLLVYNKVEVAPSYIGGKAALEKYLEKNLVYPNEAKQDGLEGTVYVDFLIGIDGKVSNVTATTATWENVDEQFNTEAIRVVSEMPQWKPGMQNGEAVHVTYSIPITFRMK